MPPAARTVARRFPAAPRHRPTRPGNDSRPWPTLGSETPAEHVLPLDRALRGTRELLADVLRSQGSMRGTSRSGTSAKNMSGLVCTWGSARVKPLLHVPWNLSKSSFRQNEPYTQSVQCSPATVTAPCREPESWPRHTCRESHTTSRVSYPTPHASRCRHMTDTKEPSHPSWMRRSTDVRRCPRGA